MLSAGSSDNALRMWIFDPQDQTGNPRLLRERTGHSAPPRVMLFKVIGFLCGVQCCVGVVESVPSMYMSCKCSLYEVCSVMYEVCSV
jgi:hypothetical protein